jgi:hypothetical protein
MFGQLKALKKDREAVEAKGPVDITALAEEFRSGVDGLNFLFDDNAKVDGVKVSAFVLASTDVLDKAKVPWRIDFQVLILGSFSKDDVIDPKMASVVDKQTLKFNVMWYPNFAQEPDKLKEFLASRPNISSMRTYGDPEPIGEVLLKVGSIVTFQYNIPKKSGCGPRIIRTPVGPVIPGQYITFNTHFHVRRKNNSFGFYVSEAAGYAPNKYESLDFLKWIAPVFLPFPEISRKPIQPNEEQKMMLLKMQERIDWHMALKGSKDMYKAWDASVKTMMTEMLLDEDEIGKLRSAVVFGPNEVNSRKFEESFGLVVTNLAWSIDYLKKSQTVGAYNKIMATVHAQKIGAETRKISFKLNFLDSRKILARCFGVSGTGGALILSRLVEACYDSMRMWGYINTNSTLTIDSITNAAGEVISDESIAVDIAAVHVDMVNALQKIGIPVSVEGAARILDADQFGLKKLRDGSKFESVKGSIWYNLTETKEAPDPRFQHYIIGRNISIDDVERFKKRLVKDFNGNYEEACKDTAAKLLGEKVPGWEGKISALEVPSSDQDKLYIFPQIYAVSKAYLATYKPEVPKTLEERQQMLEEYGDFCTTTFAEDSEKEELDAPPTQTDEPVSEPEPKLVKKRPSSSKSKASKRTKQDSSE